MTPIALLTFAAAMFLLAAAPGPGAFATVARAIASGFPHAAVLVLGIVAGDLIFLLLATYGLSAMADLLGNFFAVVKPAGGLYLIWLGIKIYRSPAEPRSVNGVRKLSWKKNFSSGLIMTLANPKVILFYLGFLPSFVDLSGLTGLDIVVISTLTATVLGVVLLSYAWAAVRVGKLFNNRRYLIGINHFAGGVMITAGGSLLIKR